MALFIPRTYQQKTIDKMLEDKNILVCLDMGLGKTACTLSVLNELRYNYLKINKVLIIAPLRVAKFVWKEEIKKWDNFRHLTITSIVGGVEERSKALLDTPFISTINREQTPWLALKMGFKRGSNIRTLPNGNSRYIYEDVKIRNTKDPNLKDSNSFPFDCLVIDESTSFKNHDSQRFKYLVKMLPYFKKIILLTGTPAPNGLINLWSQIYILDNGERLEDSYNKFLNKYYIKESWKPYSSYIIKKESSEIIEDKIKDVSIYVGTKGNLELPPLVYNYINLELDTKGRVLYNNFYLNSIVTFKEDNKEINVTALSIGAMITKLLQFTSGALYYENKDYVEFNNLKLNALEEMIEDTGDKPILVFYWFKSDRERILKRFQELKPRELNTTKDLEEWNNKKIKLLIGHPLSLGHGLNLQAGGSIIIWFSLTYDLEVYQQANKRLYRSGQSETVIINHLIIKDTIEERVINALSTKSNIQEEFLKVIDMKT